jgi:hypothetical protein
MFKTPGSQFFWLLDLSASLDEIPEGCSQRIGIGFHGGAHGHPFDDG